jgi:2-polyprenyl-3-methyl-5-hydroxy-6-metoxy-1,4-benzoquinol methylase
VNSTQSLRYENIHTKKKRQMLADEMQKVADEIHRRFAITNKVSACPCCLSRNIGNYIAKFGFQLDRCQDCDQIFTNPFPSVSALEYFYNSSFKKFENEFFLESFNERIPIFSKRINLMKSVGIGLNILDVGSAIGIFLAANQLDGGYFQITACDLSMDACNHIQSKFPNVTVLNKDVRDVPPAAYDGVTLWDTLEHIADPDSVLTNIRNLLKDTGLLIFSTPNIHSFEWNVMGDEHVQLLPPGHVNLYNRDNIQFLLERNGFEVNSIHTMNPMLDLTYISNVVNSSQDSVIKRAATATMELLMSERLVGLAQETMKANKFAGNMLVVAKKHVKSDI